MTKKRSLNFLAIFLISAAALFLPTSSSAGMEGCYQKCQLSGQSCESNCLKNLNEKDRQAVMAEKQKYIDSVKGIEKSLMENKQALGKELSQNSPDKKTAYKLQEEISQLKARRDMKHIDFILKIKEINPEIKCPKIAGKCQMKKGPMDTGKKCPMKADAPKAPPGCPAHKKNVY